MHTDEDTKTRITGNGNRKKPDCSKQKKVAEQSREVYLLTPRTCKHCNTKISYEKRRNQFCSSRCAASSNNKNRIRTKESRLKISLIAKEKNFCLTLKNILRKPQCRIHYNTCKVCDKLFVTPKPKKCCSKQCFNMQTGGYRENSVKGNGMWVIDSYGNNVFLQSSYEVRLANSLNSNNVVWIRPAYFNWIDENNKKHKYFPDFYLPQYDTYLDPKNKLLLERDFIKIKTVRDQNGINVLMFGKDHLEWDNLKTLILNDSYRN